MSRDQHRRVHLAAVGVSAALVAALVAGCGGGPDPDPSPASVSPTTSPTASATPTPSPSPSPSIDPAVAEAEAAALEAYRGFWDAKVAYLAAPDGPEPDELRHFAVDKALSGIRQAADLFAENGIAARGEPGLSPVVEDLELDGSPSATITDCVDTANWQPVYEISGESAAAPDQNLLQPTESYAFVYDGRWVIGDTTVYRDRTC